MRQLTIAEWRQKEVETLHARNMDAPIEDARRALNSFYRLAAFSERLFYINNNERLYARYIKNGYLDEMESREDRWIKRLNGYLKPFGVSVCFNGIYPSIVVRGKNNCIDDVVIYGHYYN